MQGKLWIFALIIALILSILIMLSALKKILMSFLDTSINMHCVWRYSNVDRYWWKRNHFYLIKVTRPLMSKKRNSCFDKSRDILIDSHLCFEASQNSMLHSVLRSFKIRDRGGQKLNEQWNMFSYILTWVINFARTLTNRNRHSDRKRIQSK